MIFRLRDYLHTKNLGNNQNYVLSHSLKKSLKIKFLLKSDKFLLVLIFIRFNFLISKTLKKDYSKTIFISFSFFILILSLLIYPFIYNLLTLFIYFLFINYIGLKILNILEDFEKIKLKIIGFKKRRILKKRIPLYTENIYINNLIIDYKIGDIMFNSGITKSKINIFIINSIFSFVLLILMYA